MSEFQTKIKPIIEEFLKCYQNDHMAIGAMAYEIYTLREEISEVKEKLVKFRSEVSDDL
jgi:hypothetical protein